jgi:hypothetical protein
MSVEFVVTAPGLLGLVILPTFTHLAPNGYIPEGVVVNFPTEIAMSLVRSAGFYGGKISSGCPITIREIEGLGVYGAWL